jgi:hypothetical protein
MLQILLTILSSVIIYEYLPIYNWQLSLSFFLYSLYMYNKTTNLIKDYKLEELDNFVIKINTYYLSPISDMLIYTYMYIYNLVLKILKY